MALMQETPSGSRYDFILKGQAAPKGRFSWTPFHLKGDVSHISLVSLVIVVAILFSILIFGGGTSANKPLVDLVARAQEISRVSGLVAGQSSASNDTQDLATTVQASLTSQQQQLIAYLASHGTKIDAAKQTGYQNKNTDSQITQAAQAGNLSQFYKGYLQANLGTYRTVLKADYANAQTKAKPLLGADYNSVTVILNSL